MRKEKKLLLKILGKGGETTIGRFEEKKIVLTGKRNRERRGILKMVKRGRGDGTAASGRSEEESVKKKMVEKTTRRWGALRKKKARGRSIRAKKEGLWREKKGRKKGRKKILKKKKGMCATGGIRGGRVGKH